MVHTVAVAAYDGLLGYEYAFVVEVFGLRRPGLDHVDYRLLTCRTEPGPLNTSHGLPVRTGGGLGDLTAADTVVVPGWRDVTRQAPQGLRDALTAAHRRGARVVGICSGAFPLADAGLLDTQTSTTHWLYADTFRERFPQLALDPDPLYVIGDNNTATSAGSTAGLDLCLALVADDHGIRTATEIADRMVVTHHRPGTQSQFVPYDWPSGATGHHGLGELLRWVDSHLDGSLTVDELADRAAMSRRTLIRRFHDATGTSPHAWISRRRIARARHLLETTDLTVAAVARRTGLGSATNLRRKLAASTGLAPTSYRNARRPGRREPEAVTPDS